MPRKLVKLTETGYRELTEEEREERNRYYDKMRLRVLRGKEDRSLEDIMNEYDDENEIFPLSLYKELFGEEDYKEEGYEEEESYQPRQSKPHRLTKSRLEPDCSSYFVYESENRNERENKSDLSDLIDFLFNGVIDIAKKWKFIAEYFLLGKRERKEEEVM